MVYSVSFTSDNFDSTFRNSFILSYMVFHCTGYGVFDDWSIILWYFSIAFNPDRLVLFYKAEHFDIVDWYTFL